MVRTDYPNIETGFILNHAFHDTTSYLSILPSFTVSNDKHNPGQKRLPMIRYGVPILDTNNPCPCRHKAAYLLSWRLRILLYVPFPHFHPRSDRVI